MCGAADSTATIKGNQTLEQETKIRKDLGKPPPTPKDSAAAAVEHDKSVLGGFSLAPPPETPSLTDNLLRQRRAAEFSRLTTGRGRTSSFLGGGDYTDAKKRSMSLLGGG